MSRYQRQYSGSEAAVKSSMPGDVQLKRIMKCEMQSLNAIVLQVEGRIDCGVYFIVRNR